MSGVDEFTSLMECIRSERWKQGDTGYLLSADFVKDFEESSKKKIPPGEINNSELKKRNKWKPNMRQNVDYFVVPEEKYDELEMEYMGGPKVSCGFDELGNPDLYLADFVFTFGDKSRSFRVSKFATFEQVLPVLMKEFEISEDQPFRVLLKGQTVPLEYEGGSVLSSFASPAFEIRLEKPKVVREKKQKEVKSGPPVRKITGLKNLGNSCYMNASLQSLLCLPKFVNAIKELHGTVTDELVSLFQNMTANKAVFDPSSFKQMFGLRIPFFNNTSQQDAQEFTSFLIDMLHEENKEVIDDLFYGKDESCTTCGHCNAATSVVESFTTLSLSISGARRVIFSPWKLDEQMQRVSVCPDIPLVLVAKTGKVDGGLVEVQSAVGYKHILAFEVPAHFDEEEDQGLAIIRLMSGEREICEPLLMRAPLKTEITQVDIEIMVWNRIQELWEAASRRNAAKFIKVVQYPKEFTHKEGTFLCNEQVVVSVISPYGEAKQGFRLIRTNAVSSVISLEELLSSFFCKVQLDSENKWKCEKCGEETCAFHQTSLLKTPVNLVIQLKRFSKGNRLQRDNTIVSIPTTIDLAPMFKGEKPFAKYELLAMTNHTGTLDSGHYTTMGKRGSEWYLFSDASVSPKPAPVLESEAPYLLYFSRMDA